MMNLVIDIGNTRIKAALFEGDQLKKNAVFDTLQNLLQEETWLQATQAIVCTVVSNIEPFLAVLEQHMRVLIFKADTPLPVKNIYKSAATLGSDRLAAAIGAWSERPGVDQLVIDAGTCVKYNFINRNNEFVGGAIAPGLQMRFKALEHFTDRLPLVAFRGGYEKLIGENTEESILSGVQIALLAETEGMIAYYKQQFPDLTIWLTGGDAPFLSAHLKNPIFADNFLLFKGLNNILLYNS